MILIRRLTGFALIAVIGVVALKLVFGLLGIVFSLVWTLVWLAAIGYVFYLILRMISPESARRLRDRIDGWTRTEV